MRLTRGDKQRITERVRAGAAALFRARGVVDVTLDDVMARAALTRGAFYAHYRSKTELLVDVVRHEHPLLRQLQARPGRSAAALQKQMLHIFANYLAPANLEAIFEGCSLAALTGEAARAPAAVREAFGLAFQDVLEEMARGQTTAPERYAAALVLASGAVNSARAMRDEDQRAAVLKLALDAVREQIVAA